MSRPIIVSESVRIPGHALTVRAVRASGPGGQNVNKVATKIDLRVAMEAIQGLSEPARARLRTLTRHRQDAQGRLVVRSQATRDQAQNLEDARDKVRRFVRAALVSPKARRASRPSPAAVERRVGAKKRRGAVKRSRAKPADEE
jgi:ribosome-associated protein